MVHGELWGITAEGWIALATLAGAAAVLISAAAVIGVAWYGANRFLREQEARDVRRGLIEEGIMQLRDSFDAALGQTRLNYNLVVRVLIHVEGRDDWTMSGLRPENIPSLLLDTPISAKAIGPASQLIGAKKLGKLMTTAYAILFSLNCNFEFDIRQTVLNLHDSEALLKGKEIWARAALDEAEDQYQMAEQFRSVSALLLTALQIAQRKRIASFAEADDVKDSQEMLRVAAEIDQLADATAANYSEWLIGRASIPERPN